MNISALDLMEQTQLHAKAQTDPNTTSMGDFSSTLLPIDRLSRKKRDKNQQSTAEANGVIHQLDLTE